MGLLLLARELEMHRHTNGNWYGPCPYCQHGTLYWEVLNPRLQCCGCDYKTPAFTWPDLASPLRIRTYWQPPFIEHDELHTGQATSWTWHRAMGQSKAGPRPVRRPQPRSAPLACLRVKARPKRPAAPREPDRPTLLDWLEACGRQMPSTCACGCFPLVDCPHCRAVIATANPDTLWAHITLAPCESTPLSTTRESLPSADGRPCLSEAVMDRVARCLQRPRPYAHRLAEGFRLLRA